VKIEKELTLRLRRADGSRKFEEITDSNSSLPIQIIAPKEV
jgi:hypothetical protein